MQSTSRMAGLALTLGLSILAGSALASDIYRYTDEDGNVYFTDRPPGESNVERVAIASRPTDDAAVRQRYEAQFGESGRSGDEPRTDSEQEQDEEDPPKTRNDFLVEKAAREQECAKYKARLETLEAARRVYQQDASTGERTYLDENQIDEARTKTRQLVADTCD